MLAKSLVLLAGVAATDAFSPSPIFTSGVGSSRIALRGDASAQGLLGASMMARKPFIAGNWKMNPCTVEEAKDLAKNVCAEAATSPAEVAIFVPHTFLQLATRINSELGDKLDIGAQNLFTEDKGAFTGAVSASMLKSVGAKHVLIGHSERRTVFGASDNLINNQVHKALADGLKPLLCIGETLEEYEAGLNKNVCSIQLSKDLKGVTKEQMKHVTIAYEPVWAIGTGLVCDSNIAQDVHAYIRSWLAQMFDQSIADSVRIQYGGSVTPESVDELMSKPDIDGCLVGGASLDARKFARIMNFKSDGETKSGGKREALKKVFSGIFNK